MNQQLQILLDFFQQNKTLTAEEKEVLIKAAKKLKTDFEIAEFKLERTEKVKRTTAILLEETIEELEQKRKAVEKQNRELEIESALERVRARSMAMHKSEELADLSFELVKQVKALGIDTWFCAFNIYDDDGQGSLEWGSNAEGTYPNYRTPREGIFLRYYEAGQKGETLLINEIGEKECPAHYDYLCSLPGVGEQLLKMKEVGMQFPVSQIDHVAYFKFGYIIFITFEPVPAAHEIFKRFAKVFEQTYTRFLDLKKAEAQARESQIEASLESVRASAMAMHSSENLLEVIHVMREQMAVLEEKELESVIIHIYDEKNDGIETWYSYRHASDPHGAIIHGKVILDWTGTARTRKDKELYYSDESDYTIVADYDMLKEWYEHLSIVVPEVIEYDAAGQIKVPDALYYNYSKFPGGTMLLITNKEATEDSKRLLRRSAEVFNLAYTRFLDLQKAEAQTREAVKQSSLDRIRAEIASMRSTEDLLRITPVIWGELTTLEVPFFRCGVFIIDENEKQVTVYLSAPDGHSLGVMQLAFNTNALTTKTIEHWRKGQVYTEHWDKEAFTNWMQSMIEQGQVKDRETYQGATSAPESLDLHFVPFSQGMLYVGNKEPLQEAKIDLVKSLAEAFSIAYARYEDFNKLELAKQQIEKTLVDLKQAQSQLVQSEKMASLGELTAGIAHEIQNPLNFVNNFSEVSKELLDEMKEELANGNIKDVTEIADDVIQNLAKILHHGKRADAIVKGMLQHSRSSTAMPEPTDINKLADEYLRLAYHGLRAKNKSFNAAIETEFDESLSADEAGIGNINIIPQDIGRVLLNLITNGFYAVTEKKKTAPEGYEPNLTVITKKLAGKISISVRDNGAGIPKNVVDKIFQPFFTTKPTGQGTGLGLSLSYDIVKAHGGELKVETSEGEGTTFIILLNVI